MCIRDRETVMNEQCLRSIATQEGSAHRRGVKYEVANGETIDNEGEKRFYAVTEDGEARRIVAQVCDVNKPLLSVRRALEGGNRVVFEKGASYIENTATGKVTWMEEKEGMYVVRLWVPRDQAGFARQV